MSTLPTVACLGYRGTGCQIDSIERGFRELGCESAIPMEADLVYINDLPSMDEFVTAKRYATPRGKVIQTILDLAPHLGAAFPLERVRTQLTNADAITTISATVARDIKARLGLDAPVIYNPIRPVGRNRQRKHAYRAMFVGRVADPCKRSGIAASALSILGYGWDDMVTVGREPPPYGGVYWGEASDQILSELYNSTDYLMCPTQHAFLGLPILEAMACGTIPIVCNDLDIRAEFIPPALFPEYDDVAPDAPSIARFVARLMQDEDMRHGLAERLHRHYLDRWARRLSPAGVAESILSVYATLCSQ